MRLENDFYFTLSEENHEGEYRCKVRMNPEHRIYCGHFPDNPITPGVCLLQMAVEILEKHLRQRLVLRKVTDLKFKAVVAPSDEPEFIFGITGLEDRTMRVNVVVQDRDRQFAKMTLRFEDKD